MKKNGVLALLAVGALLWLYGSTRAATPPTLAAVSVRPVAHSAPTGEADRIRDHLATVERELLARDVSALTSEQRLARATHIRSLREYRNAGVFPHNHDFPGERVPYFVDEHGTLCAMAYLIARSGRGDMVERVRASLNNARIHELAGDAELLAWLDSAGLTIDEAARIQPAYGGCCWVTPEEPSGVEAGYALGSLLAGGVGGMSIGVNLLPTAGAERPRWPSVLGIAAGAVSVGLGVERLGDGGTSGYLGAANVGIGTASMAMGVWRLLQPHPDVRRAEARVAGAESRTLTASPLVGGRDGSGLGVLLRLTF